jgi:hypothetical protein
MQKLELDCEFGSMSILGGTTLLGFVVDATESPVPNTIMLREKQATELAKYLVAWLNRSAEERRP